MNTAALSAHLSRLALFIAANRDSTCPRVVEQMHAAYTLRHVVELKLAATAGLRA
jgi:hypothetical protein